MPRIYTSITEQFYKIVKAYAQTHGLTESATLAMFAEAGYEALTGERVETVPSWGGERQSKYTCPACGSSNTRKWIDIPFTEEPKGENAPKFMCDDCGQPFKDSEGIQADD